MSHIKYIFSVNPGRSGSNYLAHIFHNTYECKAFHEPQPVMNGKPMFDYMIGKEEGLRGSMPEKIDSIEKKREGKVYVETNHCFIKGFGWYLPDYLDMSEVCIITIHRAKEEVASSFLRNNVTPLNIVGRDWIITPLAKNKLGDLTRYVSFYKIKFYIFWVLYRLWYKTAMFLKNKINKPASLSKFELSCLEWYVEETYNLGRLYRKTYPQAKYIDVHVSDLNDARVVSELLKEINITPKPSLFEEIVGKPRNTSEKRVKNNLM